MKKILIVSAALLLSFISCVKNNSTSNYPLTAPTGPPLLNTIDKTDTLKVMAYNVLNYGDGCQGSLSTLNSYLKTVIQYAQPDLLSCEKMYAFSPTATGIANFAGVITDSVLNVVSSGRFAFVTPTNIADDDAMSCLFYNKQKLTYVKTETLLAYVSDFDMYKLLKITFIVRATKTQT